MDFLIGLSMAVVSMFFFMVYGAQAQLGTLKNSATAKSAGGRSLKAGLLAATIIMIGSLVMDGYKTEVMTLVILVTGALPAFIRLWFHHRRSTLMSITVLSKIRTDGNASIFGALFCIAALYTHSIFIYLQ